MMSCIATGWWKIDSIIMCTWKNGLNLPFKDELSEVITAHNYLPTVC